MATLGWGGTIEINDGASNTFVAVPDVITIDPPAEVTGVVERRLLGLANRVITAKPGMKNPGEFTYSFEQTTEERNRHDTLRADQTIKNFKITVQDDDGSDLVKTYPGFITTVKTEALEDEKITVCAVTVRVTGAAS